LDKLETILQHTQGRNPPGFDYRFNLGYGREHTASPPLIAAIRAILDRATEIGVWRRHDMFSRRYRIGCRVPVRTIMTVRVVRLGSPAPA
jgi:hypothetical protein